MSQGEDDFALHLRLNGIEFEREYRFHSKRRWRADFFIEPNILVEIEGGVFVKGRHTRGAAFVADCEKYNTATAMGFRVFRFVPDKHVDTLIALETIQQVLADGH